MSSDSSDDSDPALGTFFYSLPRELRNKIYASIFGTGWSIEDFDIGRERVDGEIKKDAKFVVPRLGHPVFPVKSQVVDTLIDVDPVAFKAAMTRKNTSFCMYGDPVEGFPDMSSPFNRKQLNQKGELRLCVRRLNIHFMNKTFCDRGLFVISGLLATFPKLRRLNIRVLYDVEPEIKDEFARKLDKIHGLFQQSKGPLEAVYVQCMASNFHWSAEGQLGCDMLGEFNITNFHSLNAEQVIQKLNGLFSLQRLNSRRESREMDLRLAELA